MKIIFLFFLCVSSKVFAQNLPLDFENDQDVFSSFGEGCAFYKQPDTSNTSNTVGVIQNAGNDIYEGVYLDLIPNINFDNSKLVSFDFYSNIGPTTIQVKFEGSDSGFGDAFVEATVPGNGWSQVQLDFSQANIIGQTGTQSLSGNFSRIALFAAPGQLLSGTFYIDNIDGGESTITTFDELVWSDEFDGYTGAPDPTKWHHQVIPIINGTDWANGELQHYTDQISNSYVSDGTLKIKAIKENYTYNGVNKNYTSARLNSKYAFKYGRIDVGAKLPAEAGTWPAIWTLGANINEPGNYFGNTYGSVGWPDCGEIDIMEQNGWDKSITYGYMHYKNLASGLYENQGTTTPINDSSGSYHKYSLIWTEDVVQILLDDNVFFERQNNNELPYDNPHYILLNIAMGGNLGLLPGTEIPESFNDAIMEIDYVRVYQQSPLSLNASGQISKASISPNPAQNMVKVSLNSDELIKNIQLFDVTGKLILNQNNINKSSTNLYVSDLNSGLYIVVIKTNKTVITKRLVIQ